MVSVREVCGVVVVVREMRVQWLREALLRFLFGKAGTSEARQSRWVWMTTKYKVSSKERATVNRSG